MQRLNIANKTPFLSESNSGKNNEALSASSHPVSAPSRENDEQDGDIVDAAINTFAPNVSNTMVSSHQTLRHNTVRPSEPDTNDTDTNQTQQTNTQISSGDNEGVGDPVEIVTADKGLPSDPALDDGNFWEGWHVNGTNGVNAKSVWNDYTGAGVRIATLDEGVNHAHSELSNNYNTSIDKDVLDNDADAHNDGGTNETHGSHVSMMIGADDNGSQGVGVAFDSEITGIRRGFGSDSSIQDTLDGFEHAETIDAGVMNNSWGTTAAFGDHKGVNFAGTDYSDVHTQMQDMVDNGRGALGQNIVFSAGNDGNEGMSANYKNFQNSPHTITVGAIDENGDIAGFSEWGSNVLLSAPGDTVRVPYAEDGGQAIDISGTSFSAPAVSGTIGLMLEANSNLGYRDVQEILALSARNTDPNDSSWQTNGANHWNGGGLTFSHDYGYGAVDAESAVRLAESWQDQQTYDNATRTASFNGGSTSLPDTSTVTSSIDVGTNIALEHVMIDLDISHDKAGDLKISLTSPDDTTSVLANRIEGGSYTSIYGTQGIDFEFSSLAHMGETSAGTWTLKVEDLAGGNSGTLNDWDLRFTGNPVADDDTYFFTNAFKNFSGRDTINDTDGGTDTINAKPVTFDTSLNLAEGTGEIAGRSVTVSGIENAFTGKGNDTLTGDSGANILKSGRGDDTVVATSGDDTLNGQAGSDTVTYNTVLDDFLIDIIDSATVELTDQVGDFGIDTLLNFETFTFSDSSYTFSELEEQAGPTEIPIKFTGDSGTPYWTTSDTEGTHTLTSSDIGFTNTSGDALTINRDAQGMTLTIENNEIPGKMQFKGTDRGEALTLNGEHSNMAARIYGKGGNDDIHINSVTGPDVINGGSGNDTIHSGAGADKLYGVAGNDTLYGEDGEDNLHGGMGDDTLYGGADFDRLIGNDGADTLYGGTGDDLLSGDAGSDTLNGDEGNDRLFGNSGNDILQGGAGEDHIYGGDGTDTITFGNAGSGVTVRLDKNWVKDDGHGVHDHVWNVENAEGTQFRDIMLGDAAANELTGHAGNDKLSGRGGDDTLNGNDGQDDLFGHGGADTLNGGNGKDNLHGGAGDDTLYGGADFDRLTGANGADTLHGGTGNDLLSGDAGGDTLNGDEGNDRLFGNSDTDILHGGTGDDILYGGAGDDTLYGDEGENRLFGDDGADTFAWSSQSHDSQNIDRIGDFDAGEGDALDISDILTGFDDQSSDIQNFLQFDAPAPDGDVRMQVDRDGTSDNQSFEAIAQLETGGQALDAQNLYDSGNIIA